MTPSAISILQNKPDLCFESNCALAKTGSGYTQVEIGSHYDSTRLLCIGEGSGENEARESLPFRPHAQAGSMFADALREVNISRSEIAVTNIVRCFISPRTLVHTLNGHREIAQIQAGEMVLTHQGRFRKVLQRVRFPGRTDYLNIDIAGSSMSGSTSLRVTLDHRYWTGVDWIFARDLRPGMKVMGIAEMCVSCSSLFHRHYHGMVYGNLPFCSKICHNRFVANKGKENLRAALVKSYKNGKRDRFAVTKAANAAMKAMVEAGEWKCEMTPEGKISHRLKSAAARQMLGLGGATWIGFGESAVDAILRSLGHDPISQFAIEGWNYDFLVGNDLIIEVDGPASKMPIRQRRDAEKEALAISKGYRVVHIPYDRPESVIDLMDNDEHNFAFVPVEVQKIEKRSWPAGAFSLQVEEDESFVAQGFVHHNCRPPKDWLIGAPYEVNAISHCTTNYLFDVIRELRPRAILALGGTAMRALTASPKGKYGTLDYIRGYVQRGAGAAEGIPVISTYHPAFIRRGAAHLTPLLQRDLRRAFLLATGKLAEGRHYVLLPSESGLRYQTSPTIDEAFEYAETIDPRLPLSFDIETLLSTRSDEDERTSFTDRDVRLFQCTQRRGMGIALPYRDEYIGVIGKILAAASTKVGFNNWNFDDPVLASNGIEVGPTDDAMVMFGFLWSDLPKNLQAAGQMAGFPFPWKHLGESDLEFYGCCDADATLAVYQYCRERMENEGNWDSYRRYFAQVWPILRSMSQRGIPISNDKRMELKELIQREDQRVTREIQVVVPEGMRGTKQKNGLKRNPKLKCEECDYDGRGDHFCPDSVGGVSHILYSSLAQRAGLVEIEVGITGEEKCQCLKKERAGCPICAGSGIVPAGTVVRRWALPVEFNPNSPLQVKRLIKFLKHPIPKHSKRTDEQGEAAETTEMAELARLYTKTKHQIYPLLIEKRQLTKTDSVYADGWTPASDGRTRGVFTFNTATWQTSSRGVNLQNGLARGKTEFQKRLADAFNAMQQAEPGHCLIKFDCKSFHALTTAHDANLPDYARLARIDIHSFTTCHFLKLPERIGLYERDDQDMKQLFKWLRKNKPEFEEVRGLRAKQTLLGIQFGRGPKSIYTMYKEYFNSQSEAKVIWDLVYSLFPGLRRYQNAVVDEAFENKRLISKFGAIRHLWDVKRWSRKDQKWVNGDQAEQAMAFRPANHAFGKVREIMLELRAQRLDEKYELINSVHDDFRFHCPLELREECLAIVPPIIQTPSPVLIYPQMAPGGLWVEAEAVVGSNMFEISH